MSEKQPFTEPSPEEYEKITQPYRLAIGEVALAWNGLQESLARLFWLAIGTQEGNVPLAIWHSTANDRAQRGMLKAAANARWRNDARIKDSIVWLLDESDKMSEKRNNALHSPFDFLTHHDGTHTFTPSGLSMNPRAKKLGEEDLLNKLDWYASTIQILHGYSWALFTAIAVPSHYAWPDKPQLPRFSPSRLVNNHIIKPSPNNLSPRLDHSRGYLNL